MSTWPVPVCTTCRMRQAAPRGRARRQATRRPPSPTGPSSWPPSPLRPKHTSNLRGTCIHAHVCTLNHEHYAIRQVSMLTWPVRWACMCLWLSAAAVGRQFRVTCRRAASPKHCRNTKIRWQSRDEYMLECKCRPQPKTEHRRRTDRYCNMEVAWTTWSQAAPPSTLGERGLCLPPC